MIHILALFNQGLIFAFIIHILYILHLRKKILYDKIFHWEFDVHARLDIESYNIYLI